MKSNYVTYMELQAIDTAGLAIGVWTSFTSIEGSLVSINIMNESDADVYVSFNGSTTHKLVPAGKTFTDNYQANATPTNGILKLRKATVVSIRGIAGTGDIILTGYFNN